MVKLQTALKCEVHPSDGKGMGVFATEFIAKDELIEECYLIPFRVPECDTRILKDYRFYWGVNNTDLYRQVIACGFGSIYNHSDDPNAYFTPHPGCKAYRFFAKKDIQPGEEIYISYGKDVKFS